MSGTSDSAAPTGVSRRALIKRGAVVGVATAWVVPVVQSVSSTSALAATPRAPRAQPTPSVQRAPHAQPDAASEALVRTGLGLPAIAFGAGAVVLGVGAIALGVTRRPAEPDEDDDEAASR